MIAKAQTINSTTIGVVAFEFVARRLKMKANIRENVKD